MKTEYSFIYSSASMEALENLIEELSIVFNLHITADDMFYYNIFCKPEIYANFSGWEKAPDDLDVPVKLKETTRSSSEKTDYVKIIIEQVLTKEIDKPEWMTYVEEEESSDYYEHAPSTYLCLKAKSDTYNDLADKLLDFLYSPNLISEII